MQLLAWVQLGRQPQRAAPAALPGLRREQERMRKAEAARLETERILREQQARWGRAVKG